jgi:hypothetical protein
VPRQRLKFLIPAAALACFAVVSTIAWSNNASLKGDQAITRNPAAQTSLVIPDFDAAFAGRATKADREIATRAAAKVDFNQAFADAAAASRRDNTPVNREKLRNAGWTRMAGSR